MMPCFLKRIGWISLGILMGREAFGLDLSDTFQKTNALYLMYVGKNTPDLTKPVLRAFSSDGCSMSPNGVLTVDYTDCCVQHDIAYWLGGTEEQKINSDEELRKCINQKFDEAKSAHQGDTKYVEIAGPAVSSVYGTVVQYGGNKNFPNTYRWGYGWSEQRDYAPLSSEEMAQAESHYGKNLSQLRQAVKERKFKISLELFTVDNSLFTRLPSDKIVYYYLKKNLPRTDIITYGGREFVDSLTEVYKIKLQSCPNSIISFYLNLWGLVSLRFQNVNFQDPALYSKIIRSVSDPDSCLKIEDQKS